jgi:hypothetical protein
MRIKEKLALLDAKELQIIQNALCEILNTKTKEN